MAEAASFLPEVAANLGAVTGAAHAETLNAAGGVVTTEALATAQDATETRTLTNSLITASSNVLVAVVGGTNTTPVFASVQAPAAGSVSIKFLAPGAAINGTLVYLFLLI